MRIKKRFGPRNFVQYLGLKNDDYALVPKKKKKQTVFIPGVDTIYRNDPGSQAELEAQQSANAIRFIPHKYEDQRAYRYTAKALPPVVHSFDRMADTDAMRLATDRARLAARAREEGIQRNLEKWRRMRRKLGHWGGLIKDKPYAESRVSRFENKRIAAEMKKIWTEYFRKDAAQRAINMHPNRSTIPRYFKYLYDLEQEKERRKNEGFTKLQARARGMIDRRKAAHAQKQFEIRYNKMNARSSGTAHFTNGVPEFSAPLFSVGKASPSPRVVGKKRPRTGLDKTPTGVWRPNAPYPPDARTPLSDMSYANLAVGILKELPYANDGL